MARKRKQTDLRGVDRNSQDYWDEIMNRTDPMARGNDARLVYVGSSNILERIAGEREMENGRVLPKKRAQ